jgi:predicted N-acetyltransferase YhbS
MARTHIRPIREKDADRVRRILQVAFVDEYRRMGQKNSRIPTMTERLLAFYLGRAPRYSFAAERRGGLIGFCLACRWGSTAWMGPVAVLPPAQGEGVGKRLVEASTAELRENGVITLGVETMPRSYRSLQFYSSLGMNFACLTLDMSRTFRRKNHVKASTELIDDMEIRTLGAMSRQERVQAEGSVAEISDAVSPGLDYRSEVKATLHHGLGETILAYWKDRLAGFAVVHTEPYAKEEIPGTVRVNILLLRSPDEEAPGVDRLFEGMIVLVEQWIGKEGYDAAIVRVPVRYVGVRDCLLRRGYSISHSDVRMTYADMAEADRPGTVHLSKWE